MSLLSLSNGKDKRRNVYSGVETSLNNTNLLQAISDLEKGLSIADLGGNLFKIRVKRSGKGKSFGFRTIVIYKKKDKAIFLYGFGKIEY